MVQHDPSDPVASPPDDGERRRPGSIAWVRLGQEWTARGDQALVVPTLVVVLAVVVVVQMAHWGEFGGNGDQYLRDAKDFAQGDLPHSRYSPGFSLLLAPLVWATGGELSLLTRAGNLVVLGLTIAALLVLFRFLRTVLSPWVAVGFVAVVAVGQAATNYFTGIEVEPLALLVVSGFLLALLKERPWLALLLGTIGAFARVALLPFFAVVWLGRARRSPVLTVCALLLLGMAVVAHLATEPTVDSSYLDLQTSAYEEEAGGSADGLLAGLVAVAVNNVVKYGLYGLPALFLPSPLLSSPLGIPAALAVVACLALGLLSLFRRREHGPQGDERVLLAAAALGFLAYLPIVLAWPIRRSETVRIILPFAPVLIVGLACGLRMILERWTPRHARVLLGAAVGFMALGGLLASGNLLRQRPTPPSSQPDVVAIRQAPQAILPDGPVLSRYPAFTELATEHASFAYPLADDPTRFDLLAREVRACSIILDSVGAGRDQGAERWIKLRQWPEIAVQRSSSVYAITAPWCPPAPAPTGNPRQQSS